MVTMLLLALVLAVASGFFGSTLKSVTMTQSTSQGTDRSSNAMNELARVIRAGAYNPVVGQTSPDPAVATATAESLMMYSFVDSYDGSATLQVRPQRVRFSLDPTTRQLFESRWLPSSSVSGYFTFPSTTTTPNSTRNLGGPILATPATPANQLPLFTYVDVNGNNMTIPAGGFTTTQLGTIAAVLVTVRVAGNGPGQPNIVLQNTVRIPNLGYTGN
jgi:hypothetical protein